MHVGLKTKLFGKRKGKEKKKEKKGKKIKKEKKKNKEKRGKKEKMRMREREKVLEWLCMDRSQEYPVIPMYTKNFKRDIKPFCVLI